MAKSKKPKMAISKTSFKKGHKRMGGANLEKMGATVTEFFLKRK